MSRGKRIRIAKGVYRDAHGLGCTVKVRRIQKERRFPFDADLATIRRWQDDTRGRLLVAAGTAQPRQTARTTLFTDAVRYLEQRRGLPGFVADRAHLAAWTDRLGDRARADITAEDVRLAFAAWRVDGNRYQHRMPRGPRPSAPQTIRHRRRVLLELYHALDGHKAPTPCDDVPPPKVPRTVPRDVDVQIIRAVAVRLAQHNRLAYARFLVLATTGKRPAELMRAEPRDVDLRRKLWTVHPAKGGEAHQVFLNEDMLAAWKVFSLANAWGPYKTSAQAKILRQCGWPATLRPYNVRHAVAIDLLRKGADMSDIQAQLGHVKIDTTRRFYAGILTERQRQTSERLAGRLTLPAVASRAPRNR